MKRTLSIAFLLFSLAVFSQKPVVTSIDTTKNKIGAQFNLTLKAVADTASIVVFPKGKQFGRLEVIRNYPVDTIKKDARYELVKKYGLTQFDSGKYTIPSLKVLIGKKQFPTDSIRIEVANVAVDTLKQKMYDIKDVTAANAPFSNWWWIIPLVVLVIAGIGFLAYKLIKKKQDQKTAGQVFKSPIEKANGLLLQLEKKELWQKGEIKNYYSELTDIARTYIEEAIHIPAMESTTSELIAALRAEAVKINMKLSPETLENLEKVLFHADLVKFAKSLPPVAEIEEDRRKIAGTIVTIDNSIPEETPQEESLFSEIRKQQMLKKQKRTRILVGAGISIFLLLLTLGSVIAIKGVGFVKDNILGRPTKELLEGEWIASEYGNPAIKIETPRVLKRIDASKQLPKEAMALFKESQTFSYGTIFEPFNITISTITYKAETQVDLHAVQESQVNAMAAQGMKNILFKPEEFQTKEGISGTKISGTLIQPSQLDGTEKKMYYEALVFAQANGLQQIAIMYEDGDQYGIEIAKRMMNSVELKSAMP